MKLTTTTTSLALVTLSTLAQAASFDFDGNLQANNLTAQPWVAGSTMWGAIDTGSGTGNAQSGFDYLSSRDVHLLTFTFGDLELTSWQSPGLASAGFENYTEGDASVMPFTLKYDNAVIATGTSLFLRTEVSNNNDITALGTGQFLITAPGADATFYNEVMALTGGSGLCDVTLSSFFPVNGAGLFSTAGTITTAPVPEPDTWALVASGAILGFAILRRRWAGSEK